MNKRVIAVDPGDKRIGLAISDLSGTIANPLMVINHHSRSLDAHAIIEIATANDVILILIGIALDEDGEIGPRARKAVRLADAIKEQTTIPVELWDESDSTRIAKESRVQLGVRKNRRGGHHDSLAAAIILQSYLDVRMSEKK